MSIFKKQCPFCNGWDEFQFTAEQMDRYFHEYKTGDKNVQTVFPECTPEEREFLMTGMCRSCQHELFRELEED